MSLNALMVELRMPHGNPPDFFTELVPQRVNEGGVEEDVTEGISSCGTIVVASL